MVKEKKKRHMYDTADASYALPQTMHYPINFALRPLLAARANPFFRIEQVQNRAMFE